MNPYDLLLRSLATLQRDGLSAFHKKAQRTIRRAWRQVFFKPYVIERSINGEVIPFFIGDVSGEEWYTQRIEHVPELLWIRENVRQGDLVIDCGCHHGFVGVLCAKWVAPNGKVIGFEGLPRNVDIVRKNIELNHISNFEIRCAAVGQRKGSVSFVARSNGAVSERGGLRTIEVPMVSLDEELNSQKADFLKIDVEGYEIEVLRGARRVMETLPRLDLEIHPLLFRARLAGVQELFGLLPLDRYETFLQTEFNGELMAYNPEKHTPQEIARYDKLNLFARPRGLR